AVLALLVHHYAQTAADRARFLGVAGRGGTRAGAFQLTVSEAVDDAAYQRQPVGARLQYLGERGARVEIDAERRRVRGRVGGVGEAEPVVRHRLVEDRAARPGVGSEHEVAQRLGE